MTDEQEAELRQDMAILRGALRAISGLANEGSWDAKTRAIVAPIGKLASAALIVTKEAGWPVVAYTPPEAAEDR